MKIVFAGTTEHAARVLRHLHKSIHEVVAVVTREDAPIGRKAVITASPVAVVAEELGIRQIKANRILASQNAEIAQLKADVGVVIAYGALLKAETLALPVYGWYNIHYSLLPKYRGAAPVQHALMNGDSETGVTIFKLDEGMDSGPIASQVPTEVSPTENAGELLSRLTDLGISALDEVLAATAANTVELREQTGEASFAGKLDKSQARVNWDNSSAQIENLIRGLNPEPVAWTTLGDQHFRLLNARSLGSAHNLNEAAADTGTIRNFESRIVVSCGNNSLLQLLSVQPAGKTAMAASDWFRGLNGQARFE